MSEDDHIYLAAALEEAKRASARGEVPIGAVLVNSESGEIVARAGNQTIADHDPTAHAEILVIRKACQILSAQRIPGHVLYVTLEPCAMCAGAIAFARIDRLVYGVADPKGGGVAHGGQFFNQPTCHHKIAISSLPQGALKDQCGEVLKDFFKSRRG